MIGARGLKAVIETVPTSAERMVGGERRFPGHDEAWASED